MSNLYRIMKEFIPDLVGISWTEQLRIAKEEDPELSEYAHCSICGCKIDYCGDEIIGDVIACGDNALYSLNCIPRVYRFIEKYNNMRAQNKITFDEDIIL